MQRIVAAAATKYSDKRRREVGNVLKSDRLLDWALPGMWPDLV